MTTEITPESLIRMYEVLGIPATGRVAVKISSGEPGGHNYLKPELIAPLIRKVNGTIVECNTAYGGLRGTTQEHLQAAKDHGFLEIAPFDVMDADGEMKIPVRDTTYLQYDLVGDHLKNYDFLINLAHFKGHTMGGFGGSNKNIGIGCADGHIGKKMIHSREGEGQWSVAEEELMEKISESTKATIDFFGKHVCYVNVMRNMSVSCDCEGVAAAPVVTPNVGILASTDICAIDTASVDLIHAMTAEQNHDLWERMQSRHGFRQLSYMKELGMGNDRYILIDLDNDEVRISAKEAVKDVKPFKRIDF